MQRAIPAMLILLGLCGCAGPYCGPVGPGLVVPGPAVPGSIVPGPAAPGPTAAVVYDNPTLLPVADPGVAWETVVDVVDDYFEIDREDPVRTIGQTITEGRIDTFPQTGATLLEPWRCDSVGLAERLESTLQSIRRQATVRVTPTQGGYWVEVAVYKELEDVARPEHATAGAATLRYDETLRRIEQPVGARPIHEGWIPLGRDPALEQQMLADLHARLRATTGPGSCGPAPLLGPM